MSATTDWSDQYPTVPGHYLVSVPDRWLRRRKPTPMFYIVVAVIRMDCSGPLRVDYDGAFYLKPDCRDWKFAQILP